MRQYYRELRQREIPRIPRCERPLRSFQTPKAVCNDIGPLLLTASCASVWRVPKLPALCLTANIAGWSNCTDYRSRKYAWPRSYAENSHGRIMCPPGSGPQDRGYGYRRICYVPRGHAEKLRSALPTSAGRRPKRTEMLALTGHRALAPPRLRRTILVGVRRSSTLSVLFQRFCQRGSLPISGSNHTPGPSGSSTPS